MDPPEDRTLLSGGPLDPCGTGSVRPGELLADRYEIRSVLGHGGMGSVYEAHDRQLGIAIAVKTLAPGSFSGAEGLRMLKREVLLARLVTHDNVCRLHDLEQDAERDLLFATMELLRGETLEARLARDGRFDPGGALPIAEQIAAGLEAAHRAGVVHRDVKPSNVMLVPEPGRGERAVLTDFGVARRSRSGVRESGGVSGTPAYMAPEQLRGESVGVGADLYALGVVLYEMLVGRLPFESGDDPGGILRKLDEDPPSLRAQRADLPEAWEWVVGGCLAREPGDRFASAHELAAALRGEAVDVGETARLEGSLPPARDAFLGRAREIRDMDRLLRRAVPLVSLVGMGGAGKTRLALEYGRKSREDWPGGVWFCDLTEARSRDGIASAVAATLGVPLEGEDPVDQLGHAIAGHGRSLVILDNVEQVVSDVRETVAAWLDRAREASFLVTSRERLHLPEERLLAVDVLDEEAAADLFLDRALRHRPGFDPGLADRDEIRRLVRRLEGLPLAIELAAARMRMMSLPQIAERLSDRFRLLAGGRTTGRHAAMRAAIDSSWDLLMPWEKAAVGQCSVFEGGWTLEAAESVLDLSAFPEAPWTIDVLQALVDKSLMRLEASEGESPRFSMAVSIKEYAAEKVSEEERRGAERRHAEHYARLGTEEVIDDLDRGGGVEKRRRVALEFDNLIAACRRAVRAGEGGTATATLRAVWAVLEFRGPFSAGVSLGREVLEMPGLDPASRMHCLYVTGRAHRWAGRMEEAQASQAKALALARDFGDRRLEGMVLGDQGILHARQGRTKEAQECYEQALAIHREVENRCAEGHGLATLGGLHRRQGKMEEARSCLEQALAIFRETEGRRDEGHVLGMLGGLHREQGRMEEAREHNERSLAIHREVGDRRSEGIGLNNLGVLHGAQGRREEAWEHYEGALAIHRELGHRRAEGTALSNLGGCLARMGRIEEARERYEEALAIHREVGNRRVEGIVLGNLADLHGKQGRVEEARSAFQDGERLLREVGDRLNLGIVLAKRGRIDLKSGDAESARAAWEEASTLAAAVAAGPDSELGGLVAALGEALDER